jgi:3-oxoacyl-[acyl-carrier protein] reductase
MKKNIIITGGSGNLGRFLIEKYLELDYCVFNISRAKPKKIYDNELFLKCDLSSYKDVSRTLYKIKNKNIYSIISTVGNSKKNYKKFIKDENFLTSFNDNFLSFSNLVEVYLEKFKNRPTSIIAISSIAASKIIDAPIPYSVSKSALNYYCKIKAKEISKLKISLNIISPGNILMDKNNWALKKKNNPRKVMKYIKDNVPLNSFIFPEQIFQLCNYINSNRKNLTGSNMILDGGQAL